MRSVHATADEHARSLPGDDLIANPFASLTHAITIHRAPHDVWQWLAQMGAGNRAGWYSYDSFDNGRQPSANRILPELQHLEIGMVFPWLPGATRGFTLTAFEQNHFLILDGKAPDGSRLVTWTFALQPLDHRGSTRLIVRARGGAGYRFRGLPWFLTKRIAPLVHFVMQRKQLLGIATRAERPDEMTNVSHAGRRLLLVCGILASVVYIGTDLLAASRYPGYSFIDQAVSELFAIGAPTSHIVVPLFTLASALVAAFALGVWTASHQNAALRGLAVMLFGNAVNSLVLWNFFPMHMRGVTQTFTDAMHGILAINPFVLLSVVFGIAAFRRSFRFYSTVTVLVMLVSAVLSFSNIAAFVAHQPTPGMGLAERVSQYGYHLWQAMLAVLLLREGRRTMSQSSAFKAPEGEAAFLAAYGAILKQWAVPFEELDIPTRFGSTHVIVSGPKDGPPLVLLHGYDATATMWAPNIADFAKDYRVYAIDIMGQPSKSLPDEPIRRAADYVAWLTAILDAFHLDRIALIGQSFGGWLALTYAVAVPMRVRKLALLSPGGFLPMVKQFSLRGMLMVFLPTRFTVNSFMRWLGLTEPQFLRLVYLGLKHFRVPPETARVMPTVFSDDELRSLHVPTLLLYGAQEVICDPAAAVARARRLMPEVEADLIPDCSHDMCGTQARLVDGRVLGYLKQPSAAAKPTA